MAFWIGAPVRAAVSPDAARTFSHPAEDNQTMNLSLPAGEYTFEVDADPNGYHWVEWYRTYSAGTPVATDYLFWYQDRDFNISNDGWVRAEVYKSDALGRWLGWEAAYRWKIAIAKPDLLVTKVTGTAPSYRAGIDRISATATIANHGTAPAGGSNLKYWLGTPDGSNKTQHYIEEGSIGGLLVNDETSDSIPPPCWAVPVDVPAGTYRVWVEADSSARITESVETNNWGGSAQFTVTRPQVDPVVSGRVTLNGAGLSGVLVSGVADGPVTDAGGYYAATVPSGWSGTLTPSKPGYSFTPQFRSVFNVTAALAAQDFAAKVLPGSLRVLIEPTGAVAAGARWRLDGAAWQTSGTTLSPVPPGSHTADFSPVSGWSHPAPIVFDLSPGATVVTNGVYTEVVPRPDLLARFPLDGDARDASGGGHDGAVFGAVAAANRFCQSGRALHFDGADQRMVVAASPMFEVTSNLTLCAWVKRDAVGHFDPIIGKDAGQPGGSSHFEFRIEGSSSGAPDCPALFFYAGAWRGGAASVRVADTNWHHLAVIYDGQRIAFYIDGAEAGQVIETTPMRPGNEPIQIAEAQAANFSRLKGTLDDVRLYSRVLTLAEIQALVGEEKPGTVQFSQAAYSVGEAAGNAVLMVSRTGGSSGPLSVEYRPRNVTAYWDWDYPYTYGRLDWADGDSGNKEIRIPIVNDAFVEGNESFQVRLIQVETCALLGSPSVATVTIVDDDRGPGTVQFAQAVYTVNEAGTNVLLSVARVGGSSGPVSVEYRPRNATAYWTYDYQYTNGTLVWADGDAATKTIRIPIVNDAVVEGTETFEVRLSSPSGGATLGNPSLAVVTIQDDDRAAGIIQFAQAAYPAWECATQAVVTVSRVGGRQGTVSVLYGQRNGTAYGKWDWVYTGGSLVWADGDGQDKTIVVPLVNDNELEGPETFEVFLGSPTGGATLGAPKSTVVTIYDDEQSPGCIEFAQAATSVSEAAGQVEIKVSRVCGRRGPVSVLYSARNATAYAGWDYVYTSGRLDWADNDVADKTIVVRLIDDIEREGVEVFEVFLGSPGGGATLCDPRVCRVSVLDNEFGPGGLLAEGQDDPADGGATAAPSVALRRRDASASDDPESVTEPPVPPASALADGDLEILVSGLPGRTVVVESSPDLRAWQSLSTSVVPADGLIVLEAPPADGPGQFCRARYADVGAGQAK
jgi:hypothetical protein